MTLSEQHPYAHDCRRGLYPLVTLSLHVPPSVPMATRWLGSWSWRWAIISLIQLWTMAWEVGSRHPDDRE